MKQDWAGGERERERERRERGERHQVTSPSSEREREVLLATRTVSELGIKARNKAHLVLAEQGESLAGDRAQVVAFRETILHPPYEKPSYTS